MFFLWNTPNKNQTEKFNLNGGMIEPKLCTFRKTSIYIQIQFHLENKLKSIQLIKCKKFSQEY